MRTKIYDDRLIIITGACGFIGSCIVKHLNNKGCSNLLLVDDLRSGEKWKNLVGKKFEDLISKNDLFEWIDGRESEIEAFIHLGACPSTVVTDGDYIQKNNYEFSIRLAEYALQNEHRFIYASSAATYGMRDLDFSDDHDRLEELRPLNLYGYAKHMVDLWMKQQGVLDQVVGLKFFNVFGPNEYHKKRMASMVMHMTKTIAEEGIVRLFKSSDSKYGDGEQQRDFVYVKDVAEMTCGFLEHDLAGIFNVGLGVATSWNDLARAVFKAMNKKERIEYFEMPEDLKGHYLNYTCADMSKYHRSLEKKNIEKPKFHSIEEGVLDYVTHYLLENKRW
jgi:ADP-L-glycero-D-manno-heptose 6-epimerase